MAFSGTEPRPSGSGFRRAEGVRSLTVAARIGTLEQQRLMGDSSQPQPNLILASVSPRRAQLLREAGYAFTVVVPPIPELEAMSPCILPAQQAEAHSYFKARAVALQRGEGLVLGADTVVSCNGRVYGKPADIDDARATLEALIGCPQDVVTGVTLLDAATRRRLIAHDTTRVIMRDVPPEVLEDYLASGDWRGKAGAYGIQDSGDRFVARIEGSFTNVVGLPMELLAAMLGQWVSAPTALVGGSA